MKEFDFVKLTLGLSCALIVGLLGHSFWLLKKTTTMTVHVDAIARDCTEIGKLSNDIGVLEKEKRNDKTPDSTQVGINTYFNAQGLPYGIAASEDYTLKPHDPDKKNKADYVDQQIDIQFKKDRPKTREQIMKFIYMCESQSRRIKLQKARIALVEDRATDDIWSADSLVFVRRDPVKAVERAK